MLLSRCLQPGCSGIIIAEAYRGQDQFKRHSVEAVCSAGHRRQDYMPVLEVDTPVRVFAEIQPAAGFPPTKGTWFRAPDVVLVGCPKCGQPSALRAPVHVVTTDRLLNQSWTCPTGCGWHQHVILVGLGEKE